MNIHFDEEGIFEEREALMVPPPTGRISTLRNAHFLKPTVKDSINGPALKLPYLPLCSESSWPISVSFNGWYDPLTKWPKWVEKMLPKYQSIWKHSGIYEAVLGSCYKIQKNQEVVFGLAERWSTDTNTFVFQWAEASITLEDVLVLGGLSVLGHPFSMPLENQELVEVKARLDEVMKSIIRSRKRKGAEVSHDEWMEYFMDSGDVLEHDAFLALWLSRSVLPGDVLNAVNRDNFSIAIYLARGIRIALAPPVLASLYRDLSLLKQSILLTSELSRNEGEDNYVALTLWSPIQFVQIWAWERLPQLQPKYKVIPLGHPRLARWHGVNRLKRENVRWVIDAAGESFIWRPYAIAVGGWLFPEFYKDEAKWVFTNGSLSEEFETHARCLRVSELVGTDTIEAYLPHRVAMQFGMDQDIPQWIPKSNATPETAWENYSRPVCDAKLYFPPRLFEGDVTTKYLQWWEKSVLDLQGDTKGVLRGMRSSRSSPHFLEKEGSTSTPDFPEKPKWGEALMLIWRRSILHRQNNSAGTSLAITENCLTSLPKPRGIQEKKSLHSSKKRSIRDLLDVDVQPTLAVETNGFTASTKGNHPDVPPGFPPKCDRGKEILKSCNMQHIQSSSDVRIKPFLLVKDHPDGFTASTKDNHLDVPPGFPPKYNRGKEKLISCNMQHIQHRSDVDIKPFLLDKNDDVPPGLTPKSEQVKEISRAAIERGCELRPIHNDKSFLALRKKCSGSSAEGSGSSIQSEGGINCDEGGSLLNTKLSDLDMESGINLFEKILAQLKAARAGSMGVKQEPHN